MADERRNNGGARVGAGRKSKAEEFKLIEKLDALKDPSYAIQKMFDHIESGSEKMLELYMGYRFGKPKQMVEADVNANVKQINVIDLGGDEGTTT